MRHNINDNSEQEKLIYGILGSHFESLQQKIANSGRGSLTQLEEEKFQILSKFFSDNSIESLHKALILIFPQYKQLYDKAKETSLTSSSKGIYANAKKIYEKLNAGGILSASEREMFWLILMICMQNKNPTSNEKAGIPVSSNINITGKQESPSTSRKRPRTDDSDLISMEKQKSPSTTTSKDPQKQNEIRRLVRPIVVAIKEILKPYTRDFSIPELNLIIKQEVDFNSPLQPSNMNLQRSSYRGPSLPSYSTVPSTSVLNTGSLNMMNNSNPNTVPQFNRNPMTGASSMSKQFYKLPLDKRKEIMEHLKYKNRNP